MYSGFADDVIYSHNEAEGPKSSTTLCFEEFARWRHGGKVCRLWLHLACFVAQILCVKADVILLLLLRLLVYLMFYCIYIAYFIHLLRFLAVANIAL